MQELVAVEAYERPWRSVSVPEVFDPTELIQSSADGVVVVNTTGAIVYVNAQLLRLFGYEESELIGQPIEILVPDSVKRTHVAHRQHFFTNPSARPMGANLELAGRRKDGVEFAVDIALSPIQTSGSLFTMAAVRDVSDRRRTLDASAVIHRELDEVRRMLAQPAPLTMRLLVAVLVLQVAVLVVVALVS
jgi:PAS domain S-box-containing protein